MSSCFVSGLLYTVLSDEESFVGTGIYTYVGKWEQVQYMSDVGRGTVYV